MSVTATTTRTTSVGAEQEGRLVALTGAKKRCARCQLLIGEFEPVRIFASPRGKPAEISFHEMCVGEVRVPDS